MMKQLSTITNNATHTIFLFLAAMLLKAAPAVAHTNSTDSMLLCIDAAIEHTDEYVKKKTDHIGFLKTQLEQAETAQAKYELSYQLYQEYLPFVNDSAIYYLDRCTAVARQMGDESKAGGCTSLIALSCSNAGMYLEAESILHAIKPEALHGIDLGLYYYAYAHLSGEMAYYARFDEMRQQYARAAEQYRQKMMPLLPDNNKYKRQVLEMGAYSHADYKRSMALNTEWMHMVRQGSTEWALVSFYRYLEYKIKGDTTQVMHWLGESVLADVQNAVMDQGSMWELANLLMVSGDVDRSYRYLCFTSDCANRFGSRQRLSRISPLLSRIAQSYKTEVERKNRSLRHTISAISVLAVLLLLALTYLYRQRNNLALTRDQLAQSNRQLKDSNALLSSLNARLKSLNAELSSLNTRLSEANRVKEEYVGRFMRLCSLYLDKLDELKKKVAKRIKNKQWTELYDMTQTPEFKDAETSELYANFDSAFLNLFPTFVDEFNALLKPECRVTLTDEKSLNTVVRIFALIRLGITDSSKIAEFLHYSVNTIYNYRANTKNGAVVDRAEFENCVRRIGMPKEKV